MGFFSACEKCKRYEVCDSPKLKLEGEGNANVLIITAQPTQEDDKAQSLGHGRFFRFLRNHIPDLNTNYYFTSLVQCHGNAPEKEEIEYCSLRLQSIIHKVNPHTLILIGETVFKTIVGPKLAGRIQGTPWTSFLYTCIPDEESGRNIITIPDEDYFFSRKEYSDGNYGKPLHERDPSQVEKLKNMFTLALVKNFPQKMTPILSTTCIEEGAIKYLDLVISQWKEFAFDYETTGIMPFKEGHKILAVSFSNGIESIAMPFSYSERFLQKFKEIMVNPNIKKIIHNAQYEMLWTKHCLGYWPEGIIADTMLQAHCFNNHQPVGLKFQTYINFGVVGYDEGIDSYIQSKDDKSSHGFNTLESLDMSTLVRYNALDSWYTYKLYETFKEYEHVKRGHAFLLKSAQVLIKMTYEGICVKESVLLTSHFPIEGKMKELETSIMTSNEVLQWDSEELFNFKSSKQLGHLLFDILKVTPTVFTPTKKPAVNEEALQKYNVTFLKHVLEWRKLTKIKDTYLSQYSREYYDGHIHPWFYLDRVQTFRSSSGNPNIQQSPKRDKQTKKILRQFLIPREGHRFIEYDYKSLEVIINCCHSNDPTLKSYILDPSTDMHRDGAMDVFMLKKDEITKEIRSYVKGDFIFAEFYGSYYPQVAEALWEDADVLHLKAHLLTKGIKTYLDFEEHVKKCEYDLWNKRFPVHNAWRNAQWEFYKSHGYIDSLTGFRCHGPMSRNNSFNCAVQGDAYHVLQWTLNNVHRHIEDWKTKAVAEIHDSQLYDVYPDEEDALDKLVFSYGTEKVKKYWPWITCPLTIEKERSEINGNWAEMQECGHLT